VATKPKPKKKAGPKKAAPRKPAAKARAPKKATARKAAARNAARPKKAVAKAAPRKKATSAAQNGRNAVASHRRPDDAHAFIPDPQERERTHRSRRVKDDLAEELGEDFVGAATSGESVDDARDEPVPEEDGGPFVTTTAESQFAHGTDGSNPEDAEREPFPTTSSRPV
jgi:hypothetical protein